VLVLILGDFIKVLSNQNLDWLGIPVFWDIFGAEFETLD
jgi:hypothetical protein